MQPSYLVAGLLTFFCYATNATGEVQPLSIGGVSALNELLIDYEPDVRPSRENGSTDVYVSVHVIQAQWHADHLTLVFYLRQWWHDPRLQFKGYKEIRVPAKAADKLWNPSLFSPSDVEFRVLESGFVSINPDGEVKCSQRCSAVFPCILNAEDVYKSDGRVNCSIAVESFALEGDRIALHWKQPITTSTDVFGRLELISATEFVSITASGNYSRIEATVEVQTDITKQLLNYYVRKLARM